LEDEYGAKLISEKQRPPHGPTPLRDGEAEVLLKKKGLRNSTSTFLATRDRFVFFTGLRRGVLVLLGWEGVSQGRRGRWKAGRGGYDVSS